MADLLRMTRPEGDCLVWTGAAFPTGYGRVGRRESAHRASYERYVGPIPAGLEIDHLCRNTLCIRPDHLEPVTRAENMRRRAAAHTHCRNGHEYTAENTRVDTSHGWTVRVCRSCNREAVRRYKSRRVTR